MTLEALYEVLLEALPELASVTWYDHLVIDEGAEIYPPFILVHETNGTPFDADNHTYWVGIESRIDVYTADRSIDTRRQVQAFLDTIDIPYTLVLDDFDSDTMLYRDSFTITLDE